MKKYLLVLICAFAWIGVNAYEVDGSTWIVYGNDVAGKTSDIGNIQNITPPAGVTAIKFVGSFPGGWDGTWFNDNGSVESKAAITNIDLSKVSFPDDPNVSWGFSNFQNTKLTITWPEGVAGNPEGSGNIRYLPQNTFKNCGMETLHIPGYIKAIARDAIVEAANMQYLKTVIFDEWDADGDGNSDVDMDIAQQAFQLIYGLADVYINTQGNIDAANNAFPLHQTWGHGDTQLALATLHFPEEKAEDYVNMDHELDEATANDDAAFHVWLVDHYSAAQTRGNGWFEFVNSGANSKTAWPAQFLRTYSHPTLHQLVPAGVKAYIVNTITTNGNKVTLKLKSVNVIPANTGVILFGGANSKTSDGSPALNMVAVNYTGPKYTRESSVKNYLSATASNNPDYSTPVTPYGTDQFGNKHRDFVMGKFSDTDSGKKYYKEHGNYGTGTGLDKGNWVGFFRTKPGAISDVNPGKAYLCLSLDEYPLVDGGEIIMDLAAQRDGTIGEDEFYRTEYYAQGQQLKYLTEDELKQERLWYLDDQTKLEWVKSWGVRQLDSNFSMAKFNGELQDEEWMEILNNETNGISTVALEEISSDDAIYTLQGVKVNNPTKGIFIKNGKKYIVK